MLRTLILECNQKVGETVKICGWVQTRRDHGKIAFLDIHDRSGIIQVFMTGEQVGDLNVGDVVEILGQINKRPEKLINPKIETGTIELTASEIKLLSKSKTPPFPLDEDGYDISEDLRLKYRYLDLRRTRMLNNLRLRHKFIKLIRDFLDKREFVEIETPILTESTPEGARDFLVPSRLQPGKFYALPQSPQQYKQLLMISGVERYYQIARCFRDEDPRADRAYGEFTQLDLEMSFAKKEDIMALTEELMIDVFEALGAKLQKKPFPVFTYKEAMEKFGSDKFDLRTEEEKKANVQAFAWVTDYPFFEKTDEGGWTFTHNPFSAPTEEHKDWLLKGENIGEILTTQYDLVCNGFEVCSGSIRSHEPEVLFKVFEIMGYKKEEIESKFGHILEAFTLGVPPHGGIAPGVDRLLTSLTGERSLREVIAFPMTGGGRTAVMGAPSEVTPQQLNELGIAIKNIDKKK